MKYTFTSMNSISFFFQKRILTSRLLSIVLIVVIVFLVAWVFIFYRRLHSRIQLQKEAQDIIASIPTIAPVPTADINLTDYYDRYIVPFYQARIRKDEVASRSYLLGTVSASDIYRDQYENNVTQYINGLKKAYPNWKLIDASFQSFRQLYKISDQAFAMRIIRNDTSYQDEIVRILTNLKQEIDIDPLPNGFNTIQYQGIKYLVLDTLERMSPAPERVYLAHKTLDATCSGYVSDNCTVFTEVNGQLHLVTSEVSDTHTISWSPTNPNAVFFVQGFYEGTGGWNYVYEINLLTGVNTVVLKSDYGDRLSEYGSELTKRLYDEGCFGFLQSSRGTYRRVKRNDDILEFFSCLNKNHLFYHYLIFKDTLLKKASVANEEDDIKLDFGKNAYTKGEFIFTFAGVRYRLDTGTSQLTRL